MSTKHYAVGFRFDGNYTLLIDKRRPPWLAGLCNGIGGHVEEGESYAQAMAREFAEECGIQTSPDEWELCLNVGVANTGVMHVFRSWGAIHEFRSVTDEEIVMAKLDALPSRLLDTMGWMIPMLLDTKLVFPIDIRQTSRSGPVTRFPR